MQCRLLALDIDGTLLNSKGELTNRTAEAVRLASDQGIRVCLVSGRRARSMVPYAEQLRLDSPMICFNGGAVVSADASENLLVTPMPRAVVMPIVMAWETAGIPVLAFRHELGLPDIYHSGSSQWEPLLRYIGQAENNVQCLPSVSQALDWDPLRVQVFDNEAMGRQAGLLAEPLVDPAAIRVLFTRDYDGSWYYELFPAAATKANGLRWLGQHFGVSPAEMVAVGDHLNDLDMLEYAGLGVAMGNSQAAVKSVADLVIGDHDRDGLACFIEQHLLGK